ncbi:Crp/Fnr family transcriptional regulator [Burkholderia sp. Ac-20365]|jgi:CRP-like cAMP-binding protein|uniref:Crp/Fnr family transcriptional regulator n=1 Tax=Burkholderia sp. Ac-20365 TaxID=2703897 RepID=UPI00197C2980|nr:Crp/Fnr family transcriptional regulator [Burkholderia sp. Ac-20365]MBN3766239.1 Crp/Fnr family transcriptional regulator [Burkholderia sp. Ac-20365]
MTSTELINLLDRSAWFRTAPDALRTQLLELGRTRQLPAGQRLFNRGDADDGFYCVLDGLMRIGAASASGKEALLAVIEPVNWFGEIALFDGQTRTHDAYAERDTLLFHVPRAPLTALLQRTPAFWHAFGLLLTHKLRLAFDAIEEAALLPAAQRIARRLLLMAEGYGGSDAGALRRVLKVPQEDLAMMLALSRQTTNQILRQFETQGALALRYAEIEIVDAEKLRAFAASTDSGGR